MVGYYSCSQKGSHYVSDDTNGGGETTFDRITPIDLTEEMRNSYIDYAMSVIVGRALPEVRDGMKPVHRRVIYAMFDNGFRQQWEEFLDSYVTGSDYPFDLLAGARGVQLAEAGLESSRDGRKVILNELTLD